jgi:hypothetical protein
MDIAALDRAIADRAAGVLLRYFSAIASLDIGRPFIEIERDRELLRLHWALSKPVADLVTYVLEHRHEIQSVLQSSLRVEDGIVRGRLDAVRTINLRRVSGMPTAVVSHEGLRSYASGPNQVLGWVIQQAWALSSRFATITLDSEGYRNSVERSLQRLEQVRRIEAVNAIASETALNRRPSSAAMTEAGRSRRALYRLATDAYRSLLAVEAGDPNAITAMLRQTLLGPLEPWRRFELAIALCAAEEIARVEDSRLSLNLLVGDVRRPLAQAGRLAIYWQWRTDLYEAPEPEPSELVARDILAAHGLQEASDRPDLVIVDMRERIVLSIIEVKYLTGEDASDRIRSAVHQLVRYARGYRPAGSLGPLLERSLIAVSQGLSDPPAAALPDGVPTVVDFEGLTQSTLGAWAAEVCGV